MLYVWAVQAERVCSLEVEYIGWKANGLDVQVLRGCGDGGSGLKFTWANPLATLAVMEPVVPEV